MRASILLTLGLTVLSCRTGGKDGDPGGIDTASLETIDGDGDGFDDEDGDCNDADATISPSAVELCDGLDNDCDGVIDEDVTSRAFADDDGDGFGDPERASEVCEHADGLVANGNDCDDAQAQVYPGSTEQCDGLDNDCDGEIDEDVADTFYPDADGDGYGDTAAGIPACELPEGHIATGGDCDDTDAAAFPGGEEVCDEADNDCDGSVDEGVTLTWYQDVDGDGYGVPDFTTEGCDLPTGYSAAAGDCDDGDGDYNPGAAEEDCTDPADYNCDGSVMYADVDADGWAACQDCDDTRASVSPDGAEVCNGRDDDCDGDTDDDDSDVDLTTGAVFYADDDGDGYGDVADAEAACVQPSGHVTDSSDCDDAARAIHPAASEICDGGIDNDCDGAADDADGSVDASTGAVFYDDDDGDGYGDSGDRTATCLQPSGYVSNDSDCNDTSAAISPSDAEVCDAIDNDCDGDIDDADVDVADGSTWYIDYDRDGYGATSFTTASCVQPSGYVGNSSDCNDIASAIHPAASEVCDGGVDNDCDGRADDADGSVDTSTGTTWYYDGDGDGYGTSATARTCSRPSGYASYTSDCNDGNGAIHPAAAEVCDGKDNDCDVSGDEGLYCSYKLVQSDLSSGLCVDDDVYVNVAGARVYSDGVWGAQCGHVVTFTATPGSTIDLWAVDAVGGCRMISDVYIVNVSGGVGKYLTAGYGNTCGHSASTSAFWAASVAVPGVF